MSSAALIFPHQLYLNSMILREYEQVYLIEDPLIFSQYDFHKKKLILHRASMKSFEEKLSLKGTKVNYVEASEINDSGSIGLKLKLNGIRQVGFIELNDDWLNSRLLRGLSENQIAWNEYPDAAFLTSSSSFNTFGNNKGKFFFADFYEEQRKTHRILVDQYLKPTGGKWSFDSENRKKLPRDLVPPLPRFPAENKYVKEARDYVRRHFPRALGSDENFICPIDHESAESLMQDFIDHRLLWFGDYEDAISCNTDIAFHSFLSSSLNIGLITPSQVIEAALKKEGVNLNSLEGFIRQVLGWREYVRLVYFRLGRKQRTSNFFNNERQMPSAFYSGTLGIPPVDDAIKKVLKSSWCHHIERLMVLGNFMFLCRIHPDHIYRWFMELFIDAYDWVMVPNVYGMSQHADGGLITTKPYISGSNYILKMSDYKKGDWCEIWDALYWCFIDDNKEYLRTNHRMRMMVSMVEKIPDRVGKYRKISDRFFNQMDL